MQDFDLVIRGGTVVTAADTARADVGIRDGKIVTVGLDLGKGRQDIDATGLRVCSVSGVCRVMKSARFSSSSSST